MNGRDSAASHTSVRVPTGRHGGRLLRRTVVLLLLALALPARAEEPAAGPACVAEREPNDQPDQARAFTGGFCVEGVVGDRDQDYVQWTVPADLAARGWNIELETSFVATSRVLVQRLESDSSDRSIVGTEAFRLGTSDNTSTVRAENVLLRGGSYFVVVQTTGGGPYHVRFAPAAPVEQSEREPNDSAAAATPLPPNTPTAGDLLGSEDHFRFTVNPTDAKRSFGLTLNGPVGEYLSVELRNPKNEVVLAHSERMSGPIELGDLGLDPGDYTVRLYPGTVDPSPYRIGLVPGLPRNPTREDEPNPTLASAKPLALGRPFGGRIGWSDDIDVWAIEPDPRFAGKRVELKLESRSAEPRRVCLEDAQRETLSCRAGTTVSMPQLALGNARYGVKISGAADARQPYTLTLRLAGEAEPDVETEPNEVARLATPIEIGHTIRGRLDGDDSDFFRFHVTGAPQLWKVMARGTGVRQISLLDARGGVLGSGMTLPGAATPEVETSAALLLPGDYWAQVLGRDASYEFETKALGAPDPNAEREPNDNDRQAHLLRFGVPRTGGLEDERDQDVYRFSLAGPDHVALELVPPQGGTITLGLEWGYPSAKRPSLTAKGRPVVYDALLEPGDYTVFLTAEEAVAGRYELTLSHRSPFVMPDDREPNDSPPQACPFPATLAVDGTLGDLGDLDWYELPKLDRPTALRLEVKGYAKPELRIGTDELPSKFDEDKKVLEAELPAGKPVKLGLRGTGAYSLRAIFANGPVAAKPAAALPATVKLDLGSTPVAAFWVRGQRLRGTVEVANTGKEPLDLTLDASSSHFAYRPELPQKQIRVAPGAHERAPIEIAIAPDAWADRDIQIGVSARRADGAVTGAVAEIGADPNVLPLNEETTFPIPEAILGGFDVASSALGGLIAGAPDDRTANELALLHDGLTSTGGYRVAADTLPYEMTVSFGAGRSWPIRGIALQPQVAGVIYPAEQLRDFELLLSADGNTFEPALSGRLSMLPIEQAFVLDQPVEARAARLRLLSNHAENAGRVGLSEWKVITTPGEPKGIAPNLGDARRGGHIVRAEPVIGVQPSDASSLLSEGDRPVLADFAAGTRPEWVIGFHDDRAAQITKLEWKHPPADAAKSRIDSVSVAVSVASPLGPWEQIGAWDLEKEEKGVASWSLPQPLWARFIRFQTATPIAKADRYAYPDAIRVIERATGDGYLSILGEWGMFRPEAVLEWSRRGNAAAQAAPPEHGNAGRTREAATPLPLDRTVSGEVKRGAIEDWYSVTIPAGQDTLTLTATNDPTVDIAVTIEDSAGAAVPVRVGPSYASQLQIIATVQPGATYRVHVEEPTWSVAIAYDTSLSLLAFAPHVHQAVMAYAEGVMPGREYVNIMNFSAPFLLPEWTDQPYLLQGAFASLANETDSSALEETMLAVLDGESARRGVRAIILVTDAETTGQYPFTSHLWRQLAQVRSHVFPAHIGAGREPLREKQIMQDLAAANGGSYASARTQAEMDVIAARAAAWMRRPARYRLTASASRAPLPKPGSITVARAASGTQPPASSPPAAAKAGAGTGAVELIFDASGSMLQRFEGKRRIDVAHTVLSDLVTRTLPPGAPVALRVFGDDKPGSCETRLESPLAPLDAKALAKQIAAVQPKNGAKTPIAASLNRVADDLAAAQGVRTVVLVTDGEETCGGDPQAEINALVAKGFDVRVNIVGFAVGEAKLKDTFRAWAAAGHGKYFDAQSSKELGKALEAAVSEPFRIVDATGAVVGAGTVGGPEVSVPAGVYRVEVGSTNPRSYEGVVVDAGKATPLQL